MKDGLQTIYRSPWFAAALILIATVAAYGNSFGVPFVFDDLIQIVRNPIIRNLANYFSFQELPSSRPLVDLSFALNFHFGRLNVFGYHLVNLAIHVLNGLLVYLLIRALLGQLAQQAGDSGFSSHDPALHQPIRVALLAALIFAVHPLQTQAVTYIVQRYASMAALFYLLSVFCFVLARIRLSRSGTPGSANFSTPIYGVILLGLISFLSAVAALLSKQNALSLPLVILLTEYLFFDRTWAGWKKKFLVFAPLFGGLAVFALYTYGLPAGKFNLGDLLEDVSELTRETQAVDRWSYLLTQFNVIGIYLRLLVFPVGQNVDYQYPFKTKFFEELTPLAFVILAVILVWGLRNHRKRPLVTYAVFWFFITLSVESSIIPIRDALFEHRLYLPLFGFALWVAYVLVGLLAHRRRLTVALALLLILGLGAATHLRNRVWQTPVSLWSDVIAKSPHNTRAHYNLGNAFRDGARLEDAALQFTEALRLNPNYAKAHYNLGELRVRENRLEDALEHFAAALQIDPTYVEAHTNMGVVLARQGKLPAAIGHFEEALRIAPAYTKARYNLGTALARQGKLEEARSQFEKVLEDQPDSLPAHMSLGLVAARQDRLGDAIAHFTEAVRIRPDFAEAHTNLGIALAKTGDLTGAASRFARVVELNPKSAEAHTNLGMMLANQGKLQEAVEHFRLALKINPNHTTAQRNLTMSLKALER